MPWFLVARLGLGAALLAVLLFLGDHYGFNAHWRARREAADLARNAALDWQAAHETQVLEAGEIAANEQSKVFREAAKNLKQCLIDPDQAAALNVVRE